MADQDTSPNANAGEDAATIKSQATVDGPMLMVNAQYIKDLSVEVPGAPTIFGLMQQNQPDVSVNIDVNVQPLQDKVFEVAIVIKADCKLAEQVAFLLELTYGGVFTINVPNEHLEPTLLIECPRMLFPFARNIVADSTRDAGFPPVLLSPVDFLALYQRQKENQRNATAAADNKTGEGASA
ncbi:MAG: protein-export chaperone SecB [Rhodospirillales bacterium]